MKCRSTLIVGSALLAGCGGGGGGANVAPSPTYRTNLVGDSWTYNAKLDLGIFGSYTGTLVEALSSDTYNGAPSIRDSRDFTFPKFQSGPAYIDSYSELSLTGALLAEQINGITTLNPLVSDTFSVPTPLTSTTVASGTLTFGDGTTINENYKVVGTALVGTKLGGFACWVVKQTNQWSTGASDSFTIWYAPQIGNYAKITDSTINPDGSTYEYTATLASMVSATPSAVSKGVQLGQSVISMPLPALRLPR